MEIEIYSYRYIVYNIFWLRYKGYNSLNSEIFWNFLESEIFTVFEKMTLVLLKNCYSSIW